MTKEEALKKLQSLFRELFQFDFADLDFGLYRLFHLKRAEINAFIDEQLPREVDAAFEVVVGEEKERLQAELDALTQQVREQIAEDALLPTGEIQPQYRQSSIKVVRELVERYEATCQKVAAIKSTDAHKAEVFNHLYNFFRRYYEDGDFIPKRRYGARETYAVPYSGEEVFVHWANRGQHYVKTAERFRDYAFKVQDLLGKYRVRFTMTEASIPKDNTKGNTRYFFPRPDLATYDEKTHEFVLPFEYRLPTPEEAERYGSNSKAQEAILQEALPRILEAVPDEGLRALLRRDQRREKEIADGKPELPLLLKRLSHFCRRNTSDYFIHKDLRGFLRRELEFYIKDQVIHLMDLEASEADLEAKRRVVRVFRKLAEKVIEFLANIEDAQKRLFEKKKFILGVDYLVPIQHVPREFWPEILQNEGQLEEWRAWLALEPQKDLFNQEGAINEAFLEAHPTLPVHTKYFDRDFVRRLLEALPFDDVDEATDGLLVHGENYQALRLLMERYREQVKCIYIDPPYNTGNDEFVYKDRYQHSSWLAMIEERLKLAREWMREDGVIFVSIDDGEQARLRMAMEAAFGAENFVNNIVWQKKYAPQNDARWLSDNHDFLIAFARRKEVWRPGLLPRTEEQDKRYQNPDNDPRGPWKPSDLSVKTYSAEYDYPITTPSGRVVYPPEGRCWFTSKEKMQELIADNRIWFGPDGNGVPALKRFLSEVKQGITSLTIWPYKEVGHNQEGKQELKRMLTAEEEVFGTPKPVRLLSRVITIGAGENDIVLDFFAGSGTTGHAIINLNREDGGRRKFILVEMGEYFDTVLLPRIAKVMYTPEWKDGKPKREATSEEAERTPRLVKILRLESYEDALHNLAAPSTLERAAEHEGAYKALAGEDAYSLRYWIELPLREAETCLRTLDLAHPFAYSLEILSDDGPIRKPVDVVETFNYLYGLRVKRYETWEHQGRAYRAVKAADRENKRRILVIWRDMKGLDGEAERAFLERKIKEMAENGETWDEILINGDTPTPGVASLDPLFKRLMMQGEEN
ncbi:MAG: adenine-specific DNA-methyltransferase [Eubacteriales bacterium]|nr:adenine-specific DNA-methyltransferase [Eubacteriales bacterium]